MFTTTGSRAGRHRVKPASGGITQLTGDVTAGPGSGSQAATIAASAVSTAKINDAAVTLAKIQNASANSKVLGSGSAGSGAPYVELSLGTGLQISGTTLSTVGGSSGSGNIVTTGAYGSEPGSPNTGDVYLTNNSYYLERWTGSVWAKFGPIVPMTPIVDASYSWLNQSTSTLDTSRGAAYLTTPAGGGDNLRGRYKSQPSTPYNVDLIFFADVGTPGNFNFGGLFFHETGVPNRELFWGVGGYGGASTTIRGITFTSGGTAFGSVKATFDATQRIGFNSTITLRVRNDGTKLTLYHSFDGFNFIQDYQDTYVNAGFTVAPDKVGYGTYVDNAGAGTNMTVLSWIES